MSDIAIRVENISKQYRIGRHKFIYDNFRDRLAAIINPPAAGVATNSIWALKDISFEIRQADIAGIIGRNGAGKSTVLKILSRITKPTSGCARIRCRVGSLLEIGTGFHEELTGRENIYLNGAILGMRRSEIAGRFDSIVDFAEVDKFLDTPIKYYSSGMQVRLAFAIAAHLETEIVLIDEILSVGDSGFQDKCFKKILDLAGHGRTVLLVSNNMAVINALCKKVLLLDNGSLIAEGGKEEVVNRYIDMTHQLTMMELGMRTDREGNDRMRYIKYWLEEASGKRVSAFRSGQDAVICLQYRSDEKGSLPNLSVAIAIKDNLGNQFTDLANRISSEIWVEAASCGVMRCRIKRLPLAVGTYRFNVFAEVNGIVADFVLDAGKFTVEPGDFFSTGRLPAPSQGNLLLEHSWSMD